MDWIRGHSIGRGASSATVSIAKARGSNRVFAVKSMELSKSQVLQREHAILSCLSCPQVVGYVGCDVSNENGEFVYNLLMEYVAGGTLSDLIWNRGGRLDEAMIGSYVRDILLGLDYIHKCGLVHCDIKGGNILIGAEGAKIADLGCAKWVEDRDLGIVGTPVFMAPEVARGEVQSFPADIWALGCTIIEMATGSPPWMDANDPVSALYRIAFSGKLPEIPTSLSEQLRDFLVRCFVRDPKQRWSAAQLLEHPFLENLKKIQNSLSNSPTSILDDEGFWNSMEESETPRNLTHIGCSSSASARLGRIQSLGAPNWGSEEDDWITIRSNDTVETSGSDRFLTGNEVEEQFSICEMDLLDVKISSISSKNNSCSRQPCEFVNLNCEVNRVSTL